jgi:hypothetical protein
LAAVPNTSITSLGYREQSLDLTLSAPNLDALSQLSQLMAKQGLTAEIQSSTPVAQRIEAHMQVRNPNSKGHR